jgi:hypothetical protein
MAPSFSRLRSKICAAVRSRASSSTRTPSSVLAVLGLENTTPAKPSGTASMAADTVSPSAAAACERAESLASSGGKSISSAAVAAG